MLDQLIIDLIAREPNLNIVKLQGGDIYRVRKGRFRLIFHYENKGELIIDSIKIRNEDTYRNL